MASEAIFLVNPRRKRRKSTRKGRMPAGLARYWATHRRGKRRRSSGRKRRRARSVVVVENNPRRRRRNRRHRRHNARRRRRVSYRRVRGNPRRHHYRMRNRRRRRHNPFGRGEIRNVIIPAAIGAGGAIALAVGYGYLSPNLPASITGSSYFPIVVQGALALGLGYLVGRFMGRSAGNYAAMGGLTVVLTNAISPLISSAAPSVPGVSGLSGLHLGRTPVGYRMGAYAPSIPQRRYKGLGFVNPAPRLGAYSPSIPQRRSKMGAYMRGNMRPPVSVMQRGVPHDMSGGSGYTGMSDGM